MWKYGGYGNGCIHDWGVFFWLFSTFIFLFLSARHLASFIPVLSWYGGGALFLQSLHLLPVFIPIAPCHATLCNPA